MDVLYIRFVYILLCTYIRGRGWSSSSSIKGLPCAVILSGYPCALYDEALSEWQSLELQVMNQAGVRTEKLWFNFTPERLHWARYAGKNFTDRQRYPSARPSAGRGAIKPCPHRSAWRSWPG